MDGSKALTLATRSNLGHLTSSLDPWTMVTLACVVRSCHRKRRVFTPGFTGVPGKQCSLPSVCSTSQHMAVMVDVIS